MTVKPAGEAAARLGGPSRLVFRVPDNARIPFTTGGLLDWSEFRLQVSPVADVAPYANPPDAALTVRPPATTETAIELPYRLILSPTHDVVWDHARDVVMHEGRAELWHTRLASRTAEGEVQRIDEEHQLPLRAYLVAGLQHRRHHPVARRLWPARRAGGDVALRSPPDRCAVLRL